MKKLFIVDAVNFLFRSYYAIAPMSNEDGIATNALFGFIRSVYKLISDFSPDYITAIFDGPDNKKTRTALFADYKSHRKDMPQDLPKQLNLAIDWCRLAGISFLSIPGVEADDTMGSIAKWAEKKGWDIFICSSDKDLCQLVDHHIRVIFPHKDNLIVDRAKVKEIYDITPEQMVDYLAIVGDASDNIPGLEGFGPKTAAALLNTFGSLDNLLAHPEKVAGTKKQQTLQASKTVALLSRQLATIDINIDFPKEEQFFHLKTPDLEKLNTFYTEMRFFSLLKDMKQPKPSLPTQEIESRYHTIETEAELLQLGKLLEQAQELCIDTETTSTNPMNAELIGIGIAINPGQAWYIPLNSHLSINKIKDVLTPLLTCKPCIGHNIKYDLHVLINNGFIVPSIQFDTILASYLLTPHRQRHNLDQLTLERFHKIKIPIETLIGKGKKSISMADVPIQKVSAYCCEDVDYTLRLKNLFSQELAQQQLLSVFDDIELPLIPVLFRMEQKGIFVEKNILQQLSSDLFTSIQKIKKEIYKEAGEEFNLNSPKQLSTILFDKLGISPAKKTMSGFSTSAESLENLDTDAPIIQKILEYRSLEKLRSTYVDALPNEINPKTGRIHCTFNQSVAATGRLSCQNPNLQNIPVRSVEGTLVRKAFKPEKNHWSFIAADYSQIELRLLAHLSEDRVLSQAFHEGEDVHSYTASLVFDVPLKEVTQDMRRKAKAVNFGILYGQQAFGLSQGLRINFHEAAEFIKKYFKRYPRIQEYLEFCKESARKTGRVVTMTGRQRPIPDILSKNPALRAAAERLAINTPLQGTAADLIKIAMIQIDRFLLTHPECGFMLLQIHDELLFETPDQKCDLLSRKVKECMENVIKLSVPLAVDISIGKNWGEC